MAQLSEVGGRQKLTLQRRFSHPPNLLWLSVVEPERLSEWYPARVTALEPRVGGEVRLDYGGGAVTTGRVTEFSEGRHLAYREQALDDLPRETDNLIGFTLQPDTAGCALLLTHVFDDRPAAAAYAAGWDACLDTLEAELDDRPLDREAPSAERHERYVREFGLDWPVIGHDELRLERQLMLQPPHAVWKVLAPTTLEQLVPGRYGSGRISRVVDEELVEVELDAGGVVRWEVGSGPGGARIILTHSPVGNRADDLRSRWHDHVERLVHRLMGTAAQ